MSTNMMSPKVIAGVATALFILCLIGFMREYKVNSALEGDLSSEKLRSETLLSEKLLLEKEIAKFKNDIASLTGTNKDLDKALADAVRNLEAKQAEYNKIQQQNASLKNIKKQHDALVALRKELENTVSGLTRQLERLQSENHDLNTSLASLQERNQFLMQELQRAQWASVDQPRIEAVKGKKERLTVAARRTRKMKVNIDVPADLKDISFRIKDPKGNVLTSEDGTIASNVLIDESTLTASTSDNVVPAKKSKKVEMIYLTNKKLKPGIYTVEVLSENLYVSSMQVKLR